MKKKGIMIASVLSLFIVGLAGFLYWYTNELPQSPADVVPTASEEGQQEAESTDIEEAIEEIQPEDEVDTISEPQSSGIKEALTTVVDDTLDVFREEDLKIAALGDSLTQGIGDANKNGGYLGILETRLKADGLTAVDVSNYGVRGNRTDHLLKRLKKKQVQMDIKEADVILLTIGANDMMKVVKKNFLNLELQPFNEAQSEYEKQLNTIFEQMRELNPEAPIYMIGMYNPFYKWFDHIEELDQILENWNTSTQIVVKSHENIHYVPVDDLFRNKQGNLLAEDNFHPNVDGYTLMADRVHDYLNPLLEDLKSNMLAGEAN